MTDPKPYSPFKDKAEMVNSENIEIASVGTIIFLTTILLIILGTENFRINWLITGSVDGNLYFRFDFLAPRFDVGDLADDARASEFRGQYGKDLFRSLSYLAVIVGLSQISHQLNKVILKFSNRLSAIGVVSYSIFLFPVIVGWRGALWIGFIQILILVFFGGTILAYLICQIYDEQLRQYVPSY